MNQAPEKLLERQMHDVSFLPAAAAVGGGSERRRQRRAHQTSFWCRRLSFMIADTTSLLLVRTESHTTDATSITILFACAKQRQRWWRFKNYEFNTLEQDLARTTAMHIFSTHLTVRWLCSGTTNSSHTSDVITMRTSQ